MSFHVPERFRITTGHYGSDARLGNNGAFKVPYRGRYFTVIASDGAGWEHVSVSLPQRCPSWEEMCHIKALFWDDEDVVMQLHPRASEYVNHSATCLHLWRPTGTAIPTPPRILV